MPTMHPETLAALRASIEHWRENCKLTVCSKCSPIYGDHCALCMRFTEGPDADDVDECCLQDGERCPVLEATGGPSCRESPWLKVQEAALAEDLEAFLAAANEELRFLESLLPPEEPK